MFDFYRTAILTNYIGRSLTRRCCYRTLGRGVCLKLLLMDFAISRRLGDKPPSQKSGNAKSLLYCCHDSATRLAMSFVKSAISPATLAFSRATIYSLRFSNGTIVHG